MGMDMLEMLVEIEDTFGVTFETMVTRCKTPRDLIDYVVSTLPIGSAEMCASLQAFLLLRQELHAQFAIPASAIRLETPLRTLFSSPARIVLTDWAALRQALQARRWPKLRCSQNRTTLASLWSRLIKTTLPLHSATVQDMMPFVATSRRIYWTRKQVAQKIKKIILETLCLQESDYFEDALFIEDLGMY